MPSDKASNSELRDFDLDALLAIVEQAKSAEINRAPWELRVELAAQADRAILSAAPALIEIAKRMRDATTPQARAAG